MTINPELGRVVCISQARMTSTRLPGKVLMDAAGKPLLQWHLERLQACRRVDRVALATTVNAADDPVAELAARLGVLVFRGSEHDVLGRFAGCAAAAQAAVVVRVTADCPLIDPAVVDACIARYAAGRRETPPVDYVNVDVGRFPRGLDAEIFAAPLLALADREAEDPWEREHVTPFIYRRPDRFRIGAPLVPDEPVAPARWCVDETVDLELIRRILGEVGQNPGFGWRDCCMVLARHPDWPAINHSVAQAKPNG